jgi:hypothetical protein
VHRLRPTLVALVAAGLVVAGSGGRARAASAPPAAAPAPMATLVRIEGCVLDAADRPAALPVRAIAADGRLLARTQAGRDGVFRLRVPARATVRLIAMTPRSEPLTLLTGSADLTVMACLRAPRA